MTRLLRNTFFICLIAVGAGPSLLYAGETHENPMHPQFQLVDAGGRSVRETRGEISDARTCGTCHNADFINGHNVHRGSAVKTSCIACHYEGGKIAWTADSFEPSGLLKRSWIRISEPKDENCAFCHGLVYSGRAPLRLPDDFNSRARQSIWGTVASDQSYDLTLRTGAVVSAQNLSDSFLNLAGKAALTYPWDAHARRQLQCTHCHFAANNPERANSKEGAPAFLKNDPRRLSLNEYLRTPDHRLASADCASCHEPLKVHNFLPYKERHMQALACTSCHVPRLMGPAYKSVDATVVNEKGEPRIEFRGLTTGDAYDDTAYTGGYSPFLLPVRKNPSGATKLAPFNVVTRWQWVSGPDREAVPSARVRDAYLAGSAYRPEVLRAFDKDGDGRLSAAELILDSPQKVRIIKMNLEQLQVADPEIIATIEAYPVNHGVVASAFIQADCSRCHASQSRLNTKIALAAHVPAGVLPVIQQASMLAGAGKLERDGEGRLWLDRPEANSPLYVFGHTAAPWLEGAGLILFTLVVILVAAHASYRIYSRKRWQKAAAAIRRVYLFSNYERIWHWTMALSVLALLLTGFRIHYPRIADWPALPQAVFVHNFFAVVLTVNAFLSLFYHLAANAILQFLPQAKGLEREVMAHARYYLFDIFQGRPHPTGKTPERKLNVLQQITYLLLLNVLFPLQILTGILIWGIARWPDLAARLGGLTLVAPLHQLGAWMFLSFFVLHVYLTTTGHTVLSNIKSMIDGFGEIDLQGEGLGERS